VKLLPLWFGYEQNLRCIFVMIFCLFCVVKQHCLKITVYHHVKEDLCHFSTNIPAFLWHISWRETDIVVSSDSLSHLIYRAFRRYFLTFICYCTAGLKLGLFSLLCRSKSVTAGSSIFCPLASSAQMSLLDFTATVKL